MAAGKEMNESVGEMRTVCEEQTQLESERYRRGARGRINELRASERVSERNETKNGSTAKRVRINIKRANSPAFRPSSE